MEGKWGEGRKKRKKSVNLKRKNGRGRASLSQATFIAARRRHDALL